MTEADIDFAPSGAALRPAFARKDRARRVRTVVLTLARYRALLGPALLVSVGYMDPGNWATDLQAGAQYGCSLLWVVALASVMAAILQVLAARMGLLSGKDLAQACRAHYPAWTRVPLWLCSELGIIACDLAEVLGSAVALNLLFHIPLLWAVILTAGDVLLLLALQHRGMRFVERLVFVMVGTIVASFYAELFLYPGLRPDFGAVGHALTHPTLAQPGMAGIAVGIIGATVMPHNLYLHSALVRGTPAAQTGRRQRLWLRCNLVDTTASMAMAFLVNAAILLLAARLFSGRPSFLGDQTDWIRVAYLTFAPAVGVASAGGLFAISLLASGQSSTITGTIAGEVVMSGFLHWRVAPWKRRLASRLLAIIPAVLVIGLRGGGGVTGLLVLSQIALALQLPFVMIPLLHISTRYVWDREGRRPALLLAAGWACAATIIALDAAGLPAALSAFRQP